MLFYYVCVNGEEISNSARVFSFLCDMLNYIKPALFAVISQVLIFIACTQTSFDSAYMLTVPES